MPVPARVLLVDDDPEQCETLADLLEALGCAVTARTDPVEALRASRLSVFDLVLIDLKLPGMQPLEFLERIRGDGHRFTVLVVGERSDQETEAALQAGADGVLEKPIPVERLQAWVLAAEGIDEEFGASRGEDEPDASLGLEFCLSAR